MVAILIKQTFTSEFDSSWVPHSYGLVPHLRKKLSELLHLHIPGASSGVIVSKLDKQTFMSEFDSHWVPHSYGTVLHLSKKFSKLLFLHPDVSPYV